MLDALRQVPFFASTPEDELQWVLEQGTALQLPSGERLVADEGEPANYWYVLLQGTVRLTKKLADQEALINIFESGSYFGEIPILLGKPYFVNVRTLAPSYLLRLSKDCFWEMVTGCPAVSQAILKMMAERMQIFQSVSQQQQKLVSLGTLAAGLAHELNNPAAAVRRGAHRLQEIFCELPTLSLKLQSLAEPQRTFLADLLGQVTERPSIQLDPLTVGDREEALSDWLEAQGIPQAWQLAPTLVAAGIEAERLQALAEQLDAPSFAKALNWLEATLTIASLVQEVEQSTARISELVSAIKAYSYMDQAPLQEVDLHQGLENTLTILHHKLKHGITVRREYDQTLPRICAYGSELNQVWTNLIDNAVDAMQGQGELTIWTSHDANEVLVAITDTGSGIPAEIQPRIFEPFFTTKGVGAGSGLGLDIAHRIIVQRHKGDIHVASQPGETCFQVRLPVQPPKGNPVTESAS